MSTVKWGCKKKEKRKEKKSTWMGKRKTEGI